MHRAQARQARQEPFPRLWPGAANVGLIRRDSTLRPAIPTNLPQVLFVLQGAADVQQEPKRIRCCVHVVILLLIVEIQDAVCIVAR